MRTKANRDIDDNVAIYRIQRDNSMVKVNYDIYYVDKTLIDSCLCITPTLNRRYVPECDPNKVRINPELYINVATSHMRKDIESDSYVPYKEHSHKHCANTVFNIDYSKSSFSHIDLFRFRQNEMVSMLTCLVYKLKLIINTNGIVYEDDFNINLDVFENIFVDKGRVLDGLSDQEKEKHNHMLRESTMFIQIITNTLTTMLKETLKAFIVNHPKTV